MPDTDLDTLSEDFHRLQTQKMRRHGGVEARVLTNLSFYFGEHYVKQTPTTLIQDQLSANKLHLVFNLVKKHVRRKLGRLSSVGMRFGASPDKKDPRSDAQAEIVDKLILALDDKVSQPMRTWEIAFWLLIGGTAVEHVPWVPDSSTEPLPRRDPETGEFIWTDNLTGQTLLDAQVQLLIEMQGRAPESFSMEEDLRSVGDVGSIIHGPLNVFVDASVRDVASLSPGQRIHIAEVKTVDWIRDVFGSDAGDRAVGSDLSIVKTQLRQLGPSVSGTSITDLIPAIQGSKGANDPDMAVVVTSYAPPSEEYPSGHESFFVPDRVLLDDRPNPYEEIPIVDYHYDPSSTSFWSSDFVTDLVPANKFLNKRMSQLGEQANASIYDLLLLGPEVSREDMVSDAPGYVENGIAEDGKLMVARLPGPSLPGWFLDSIRLVIEFLDTAGGSDLFSEKNFPGQLRGSLAVSMLQEILDSEDGPLYAHMGDRSSRVKQMRINRVKQFYPPVRTLNYAGRSLRDETMVLHTSKVLRAGTEFNIGVDRRSLLPELSALREARVRERLSSPLSILYIDPRTGTLDPSKIAEDLQGHDLERESKESQGRKLAKDIVGRLWRGETVEAPMPFYPHRVFMDELETAMLTTEFLSASPVIRNAFISQWNAHREVLQQTAERVQQAAEAQQVKAAVAQATQQVAAKTAAITVEESRDQIQASQAAAPTPGRPQGPSTVDGGPGALASAALRGPRPVL